MHVTLTVMVGSWASYQYIIVFLGTTFLPRAPLWRRNADANTFPYIDCATKGAGFRRQDSVDSSVGNRGGTTTTLFCQACGLALVQLFGTLNVWIVAFETPGTVVDSRDDLVSDVVFPKHAASTFPHLRQPSSTILNSGAFWIEHIPSYVGGRTGERRGTFSHYALLISRTSAHIHPDAAYLLSHAARVMGNALPIISDNASLRQAIRAISGSNTH